MSVSVLGMLSAVNTSEVYDSASTSHSDLALSKMANSVMDADDIAMTTETMAFLSSSSDVMSTSNVVALTPELTSDLSTVENNFFTESPSLELLATSKSFVQTSSSSYYNDYSSITPSLSQADFKVIPTLFPSSGFSSDVIRTPFSTPAFESSSTLTGKVSGTVLPTSSMTTSHLTLPPSSKSSLPSSPLLSSSLAPLPSSTSSFYSHSIQPSSVIVPSFQSTNMFSATLESSTTTESSENFTAPGHVPSPAANIPVPLGLAIAIPICAAVVIILVVVALCFLIHRKRHKGGRKSERTISDKELWMNTTLELPPLPPSPVSLENGHIIPLSQADPPGKDTNPEYEVIHEFEARLDSQLSLAMGQILNVFERADNGWWRGCRGSKMGWFPSDYVKRVSEKNDPEILEISAISDIVDEEQSFTSHPIKPAVSSFLIRKKGQEEKSPADLVKESKGRRYLTDQNGNGVIPNGNIQMVDHVKDEDDHEQDSKKAALNSPDYGSSVDVNVFCDSSDDAYKYGNHRYQVLHPVSKDVMSLGENEIVTAVEDLGDKVKVRRDDTGEEGVVPLSYLKLVDPLTEATWRLQEQLKINRRLSSGQEHLVGIEHCAIYPYTAQHAEDLSFGEGETIVVLNALENGWWHGLIGDETGWFPGSYVEMKEGGSTPPGGIYEKGGNLLSDQSTSGSPTSSQNSSHADLVRNLSEALLRRKDSAADTVSNTSASTLGSDENRPKPVRKAPAPPSGTKSLKKKIIRRPSRPAPPPPAPPTDKGKEDNPIVNNVSEDAVHMRRANGESRLSVSTDNRTSYDSAGGHSSDTTIEKPPPPKRFVTPKMVKIPKRKLKLQNSTMLPAPPERPVPPRPPAVKDKRVDKKSYKKKSSKKSKKESKYRGSINKLSKADISGPLPLEDVTVNMAETATNNKPDVSVDLNDSSDEVFKENDVSLLPMSSTPIPSYKKQRLEKSQSHIPPPVAPKPKNVLLHRLSQKSNQGRSVKDENIISQWNKTPSRLINGNSPKIVISEPKPETQEHPVPKPRRRNSSEEELNSQENIPIEIIDNRSKQKKKSLKKCICDYTAQEEGELSFEHGSFIKQINEVTDRPGWYMGMLADGTVGLYHHSSVEDSTLNKHSVA